MKVALIKKGVKTGKDMYTKSKSKTGGTKPPRRDPGPYDKLMVYKPKRTKWGQAKKDIGIFGKSPTGKAIKKYGGPTLIAGTGFELWQMHSDNKNNKALKAGKKASIARPRGHTHGPYGQVKKY